MRQWVWLFFLLSSCASLDSKLNTWIGSHRDELLRTWGPPQQEAALSSGHQLMVYTSGRSMYVPVGGIVHQIPQSCRIQFETDSEGVIKTWRYQGNCR